MNIITQIIKIIFSILEGILKFIFEIFEFVFDLLTKKRKEEYTADFESEWGSLVSSYNQGFCLTGRRNLSIKDSYQNALIVGGTGVGKTSVVLLPSLYTMQSSFVVHDPSGELYAKSAGYLKSKGYDVKVLHFANPKMSCGYNPLIRCNTSSDIQRIASMLVHNTLGKNSKDPFWNTQAVSLMAMLITILKKQDKQYQNLFNVRQLLNYLGSNPQAVDQLFSKHADDILFSEYKSFLAYDEKVTSGVIATCKAALTIFSDEFVAKITSTDNLDFMDFRNKPTILFIQNSVADQRYFSIITSIFFEQFISFVLSRFPANNEQDIFFLIDEASSLNIPTLPLAVANIRKHRTGAMLLLQDYNQLVHNYGKYEADAIKSNCYAKMYFTGQSLETATDLEKTLGKFEFKDKEGRKVVRSLMTNDEIRMMDIDRALLICGNTSPIKAKLRPYYERIRFSNYSSIPVPEIENEPLFDSIPVLPINAPSEEEYEDEN